MRTDGLALLLRPDDVEERVSIGVLVALGLERSRQLSDQRGSHLQLTLADLGLARRDVLGGADLVVEEHPLEHDHAFAHAQAAEMLLVAHDVLRDRGEARAFHGLEEKCVHAFGARLRTQVVRALEVDRIDLLVGHEVLTPSAFTASKSSSSSTTSSPLLTSNALTISSSGTGSSSALQIFW